MSACTYRPSKSSLSARLLLRRGNFAPARETGSTLAIALIASGVLFAGSIGLAIAGSAARESSARQYLSRQAQDVAEAGLTITLEKLNGIYRYLLVRNLANWSSTSLVATQICPNARTDFANMPTSGTISSSGGGTFGSYSISSYTFSGSPYYGGTGILSVTGKVNQSGRTAATSTVTASIQVVPKNCGGTITTPPTTSGFPGLIGLGVSLGNNDIYGTVNGNILCMTCTGTTQAQLSSQVNQLSQSTVNGSLFGGSIPLPPIPSTPSNFPATGEDIKSTKTYTSGTSNGGFCVTPTNENVTYCRIKSINLKSSDTLTFVGTSTTPMRVYIDEDVSMSGNSRIIHNGSPENLAIFGHAADSNSSNDQQFVLNGGSTATSAFIYMPDGCVGINGGSSNPDLIGAIWAKQYGETCGSSSNNGDILIPDGMGGLLTNTLGDTYNVSIRDFAAAGIKSWSVSTGS